MFSWLTFVNACLMGLFISCLFTATNLFHLTLTAELCWVSLYTLAALFGTFIDDAGCFSLTFFILGFAAIELCFGLLLLLLMRHFNLSIFLPQNQAQAGAKIFNALYKESLAKKRI